MGVETFALGGLCSFGGGCGCRLFDREGMCGFGGGEVVGGFVLGLVSFVLVWHGDYEGLMRLQLVGGRAVVTLLVILDVR